MTRLPFGRHKGELIENVPRSYLEWMIRECGDMPAWLALEIEQHLAWLDRPKPPVPAMPRVGASKPIERAEIDKALVKWKQILTKDRQGDESATALIEHADVYLRYLLGLRQAESSGRSS